MKTTLLILLLGFVASLLSRGAEGFIMRPALPTLGLVATQQSPHNIRMIPSRSYLPTVVLAAAAPRTPEQQEDLGTRRRVLLQHASCLLTTQLFAPKYAAAAVAAIPGGTTTGLPASYQSKDGISTLRTLTASPLGLIDDQGFLRDSYPRVPGDWESTIPGDWESAILTKLGNIQQTTTPNNKIILSPAKIRNVPGGGSCLFQAISTCMFARHDDISIFYTYGQDQPLLTYPDDTELLLRHSAFLRQQSVERLRQKKAQLFVQGNEYIRTGDLVKAAAAKYGVTSNQYLDLMEQDVYWGDEFSVWGGGPEIVALSNVFKVPIHVYELKSVTTDPSKDEKSSSSFFVLQRLLCIGSPKFDNREPLHILSADSRFPDLQPGEQLKQPDHFLAMFPTV